MEMALYHPGHGYYERPGSRIGKLGDFRTGVSVGTLFGELLGFQIGEWLEAMPEGGPCQVVEAGAHDGRLAADLLAYWQGLHPRLLARIEYWIIEPSASRQGWQQETLKAFGEKVRWFESLDSLRAAGVRGVIFANELLLDAFPVHRLGWGARRGTWFEWGFKLDYARFVWVRMDQDDGIQRTGMESAIKPPIELSAEMLALLPDGFTTEPCSTATAWWRRAAEILRQGILMTIDYGLVADELFRPERVHGTVRACYRHYWVADVLANAGRQDLSASVNFTALQRAGESAALVRLGLTSQAKFLMRIVKGTMNSPEQFPPWSPKRLRQLRTLTHPEHLGRSFKVLWQARRDPSLV
jgi:SAM-dependent MidA family methyltransferase